MSRLSAYGTSEELSAGHFVLLVSFHPPEAPGKRGGLSRHLYAQCD